jgi:hypothetical protein
MEVGMKLSRSVEGRAEETWSMEEMGESIVNDCSSILAWDLDYKEEYNATKLIPYKITFTIERLDIK